MTNKEKALQILSEHYKEADTALKFNSIFELIVCVILSAQCTDARVNKVANELFKEYNTPEKIASMDIELLETYIKSCGLYKNKAKNLKKMSEAIVTRFNGQTPQTREELMSLAGVGRKTANVVLSVGFGKPAFAVDTHVFRVANRIGLADAKTPEEVEKQITAFIPKEKWGQAHHWLIWHGRKICRAQKPDCLNCPVNVCCKFYGEKQI